MKIIEGNGWMCGYSPSKMCVYNSTTTKKASTVEEICDCLSKAVKIVSVWGTKSSTGRLQVVATLRANKHKSLVEIIRVLEIALGYYDVNGFGWTATNRGNMLSLEYRGHVVMYTFNDHHTEAFINYIHQLLFDNKRRFYKTVYEKLNDAFSKTI